MRGTVAGALALLAVLGCGGLAGAAHAAPRARSAADSPAARRASRAQQVARAAVELKKLGLYKGDTSGKWSPELHEAVRAFQRSHGLKETGRLNRDTRAALGLEPGARKTSRAKVTRASRDTTDAEDPTRPDDMP
ncbi:MAG TPA: peptidoglycan-binding domain-containing protein [Candidatus Saccharimonadales bacterium]|nr:peptidoglycan-binding domain-containing protein [Candidatus Saccharimonadales bacterium]